MSHTGSAMPFVERSFDAPSRHDRRWLVLLAVCITLASLIALALPAASVEAATIVVTTDVDEDENNAACSLREAITAANTNSAYNGCLTGEAEPVVDAIEFQIPGGGVRTIAVGAVAPLAGVALPALSETVRVEGLTQGGVGYPGPPIVHLAGSSGMVGLDVVGDDVTIVGLVITGFDIGINVEDAIDGVTGTVIRGNYVGLGPDGLTPQSNGVGIRVDSAFDADIGGDAPAHRNVISGNSTNGVEVTGVCGCDDTFTRVRGNYVGLNAAGSAAVPNGDSGIMIQAAQGLIVGGTTAPEANVVSGNTLDGITLLGISFEIDIIGNRVGTNPAGTAAIPNGRDGVALIDDGGGAGPVQVRIGTGAAGAGNLISGNGRSGILLDLTLAVEVLGNLLGLAADGTTPLPNATGITIVDALGTKIGGITPADRNVISGNTTNGIDVSGSCGCGGVLSQILGNYVGLNAAGTVAVPNGENGIHLFHAEGVVIGGVFPGEGNVISGNTLDGIQIVGEHSFEIVVVGNTIGTNPAGTVGLGNGRDGVSAVPEDGSNEGPHKTVVGSETAGTGNLISGNGRHGVYLLRTRQETGVVHNLIGVNRDASGPIPNARDGVLLERARRAFVLENIIAHNQAGIVMFPRPNVNSIGNVLSKNLIYANVGLGIDVTRTLDPGGFGIGDGVTPNDLDESDFVQNYPVLTTATTSAQGTVVAGTIASVPDTSYRVEIFTSPSCDQPSGFGEGMTFLGGLDMGTDGTGSGAFNIVLGRVPTGHVITATATNVNWMTSEFSECLPVTSAEILVNPTGGLTTSEAGGEATFTVALSTIPTADVTVNLTSSKPGEATVSPASLTFTPVNGKVAQSVTVTGVADAVADGNQHYAIVTAPAISADPVYSGMDAPDVSAVNQDSGTVPTLSIEPAQVTEGDSGTVPMSFTVRLEPASTQTVTAHWQVVNGTAQVNSDIHFPDSMGVVTFNPGEVTKSIVVGIIGDTVPEPTETFTVRLQTSNGGAIGVKDATGTITDNDAAAGPCSPRPNIEMTTMRSGTDQLVVSVKAGSGTIKKISFGAASQPMQNAQVETVGPASVIQGFGVFTPPPNVTQQSFVLRRIVGNQPSMVTLVIEDGCGEWKTFVGTGANPW